MQRAEEIAEDDGEVGSSMEYEELQGADAGEVLLGEDCSEGTPEQEQDLERCRISLEEELKETELMLRRLQAQQATQASELQSLKDNFSAELSGLRMDSWKLAEFAELEKVKNSLITPICLHAGHNVEPQQTGLASYANDDPFLSELDAEMASIQKQLTVAQNSRREMEIKKNALTKELHLFQSAVESAS